MLKDLLKSPQLAELEKAIQSGNKETSQKFWETVKQKGTPLIEEIPGDNEHLLVTFLWREEPGEKLENVLIDSMVGKFEVRDRIFSRLLDSDVWYKTYRLNRNIATLYILATNDPLIPLEEMSLEEEEKYWENFQPDPLNHAIFLKDSPWAQSIIRLPGAPLSEWLKPQKEQHKGEIREFNLLSTTLAEERRIWVYTPSGYPEGAKEYNLLFLFDGEAYKDLVKVPLILDNLHAARKIEPVIAIFIDQKNRMDELTGSELFTKYVAEELVPWVWSNFQATKDPAKTIIGGFSIGGLAAAFVGLRYFWIFGKILSQSGAFWWRPGAPAGFDPRQTGDIIEYEWLAREFVAVPKLPLHFYIEAGLLEDWAPSHMPSLLLANRHFRDILQAKGYQLTYHEFAGGHTYYCWQSTFGQGLLALLKP